MWLFKKIKREKYLPLFKNRVNLTKPIRLPDPRKVAFAYIFGSNQWETGKADVILVNKN